MFKLIASVLFFVFAYSFSQDYSETLAIFKDFPKEKYDLVLQRYFYGNIISFISLSFGTTLLAMGADDYYRKK